MTKGAVWGGEKEIDRRVLLGTGREYNGAEVVCERKGERERGGGPTDVEHDGGGDEVAHGRVRLRLEVGYLLLGELRRRDCGRRLGQKNYLGSGGWMDR